MVIVAVDIKCIKINARIFISFQGLFRNYGDSILQVFKPHIERLATDSQESSQRCLTEIVAGLMRGSKHWGFQKVKVK